jgi:hypothetical protein
VGFVVDKVAPGQVFSEYFGFPCQSSFHRLLHNHHHLSSGASSGRSTKWTQSHPTKNNKKTKERLRYEPDDRGTVVLLHRPSKFARAITLLTYIREVLRLNLGQITDYPGSGNGKKIKFSLCLIN